MNNKAAFTFIKQQKMLSKGLTMTSVFPTHRRICGGAPQIQHRPPHIEFGFFFIFFYRFLKNTRRIH